MGPLCAEHELVVVRIIGDRFRWARVVAIAASLLLFVIGVWVGRISGPAAAIPSNAASHVLLLLESKTHPVDGTAEESDQLFEEYSRWARESSGGAVLDGERLGSGIHRLGETGTVAGSGDEFVSGFFLIGLVLDVLVS